MEINHHYKTAYCNYLFQEIIMNRSCSEAVFQENNNEEKKIDVQVKKYNSINIAEREITNARNYQELFVMSLLSAIFAIAAIPFGMGMGYSAILLPQLKNINGSLHVNDEMGSWIASIPAVSHPFGAIVGGILMDLIGRKLTLQIQALTAIFGWICIAVAEGHALLLSGRVILGFASAIGVTAGNIYIAEITRPTMRGVVGCIPLVSSSFGVLLTYTIGSIIHWRLIAGLAVIPAVLVAVLYFIIPDSPDWLLRKAYVVKARKSLLWLRGNDIDRVGKEMQQLTNKIERENLNQHQNITKIWTLFATSQILKPLIFTNAFSLLHFLSGWHLLILYAVEIISYMEIKNIDEHLVVVLYASARFAFTIITIIVVGNVGRRKIGICAAILTGTSAFSIAISLYFDFGKTYFIGFNLFLYVASSTIGFSTLPSILTSELFPSRVRAAAGCITHLTDSTIMFSYPKLFPFLKNLLDIKGIFLLFGMSSILSSLLIYAILPETKDKNLLEIEEYYLQNNILWINRNKNSKNANESINCKNLISGIHT